MSSAALRRSGGSWPERQATPRVMAWLLSDHRDQLRLAKTRQQRQPYAGSCLNSQARRRTLPYQALKRGLAYQHIGRELVGLPDWTDQGLLPPGIHAATLEDVHERFVLDAPHQDRRGMLFRALRTYMELLQQLVPAGRVWIDGGFGTRKDTPPHDVDVVIHPADWEALQGLAEQDHRDLLGLLTHRDIIIGSMDPPQWWERIQPIGGVLDGFLCYPGQEAIWEQTWSSVKGPDGEIVTGAIKGFVEVSW